MTVKGPWHQGFFVVGVNLWKPTRDGPPREEPGQKWLSQRGDGDAHFFRGATPMDEIRPSSAGLGEPGLTYVAFTIVRAGTSRKRWGQCHR